MQPTRLICTRVELAQVATSPGGAVVISDGRSLMTLDLQAGSTFERPVQVQELVATEAGSAVLGISGEKGPGDLPGSRGYGTIRNSVGGMDMMHAPLSDPGGTFGSDHTIRRYCLPFDPTASDPALMANVAQSRGLHAPCVRFTPPVARRGATLGSGWWSTLPSRTFTCGLRGLLQEVFELLHFPDLLQAYPGAPDRLYAPDTIDSEQHRLSILAHPKVPEHAENIPGEDGLDIEYIRKDGEEE